MSYYNEIDIKEDDIFEDSPGLLRLLLKDHNTSKSEHGKEKEYHAIIWATDEYSHLGNGYGFYDEITPDLIVGTGHNEIIQPRIFKEMNQQYARSKEMAEVFTPSWMCNEQNNLVDDAWFNKKNVFNKPSNNNEGMPWIATPSPIKDFPKGKTWIDYVKANRLEISCGEAPYLTSRYDTTTGVFIPFNQRIGLLDRKLRVVSENCDDSQSWLHYARFAYQSIYGYEWQGDNLLLARESLFATFNEAYEEKFQKKPPMNSKKSIAYIISWNIWQMDGLRCVVPGSCHHGELETIKDCMGQTQVTINCKGCQDGTFKNHRGKPCYVMDWKHQKKQRQTFASMIKFD